MEKPTKIVNKSQIQSGLGLKGPLGSLAASFLMSALEINKLNRDYEKVCQYEGPEFSKKTLELYDITVDVPAEDLNNFPEGQFVTISNHAFGGVDGLILSSIAGSVRKDYKILTNFILSLIPALKDTFMPVNPFKNGVSSRSSFSGIKNALKHIKEGGSLGLFPAGAVSTWQKRGQRSAIRKKGRVIAEDCPWMPNMAKLVKAAGAPVVPIYFEGGNSLSMHLLGKIYHLLRTSRLVHELRNKRGKTIRLRIGKPIMPEELEKYSDDTALINYLRNRVYCLEASFKEEVSYSCPLKEKKRPIAQPVPTEEVVAEIESLGDKVLFETSRFKSLFVGYDDIPVTMKELGRLREESFRAIGEGTGKEMDTDSYDRWYKHLLLWDKENSRLAGAYRLGIGSEIYENNGGIKGFYSASLVRYDEAAVDFLRDSIELGRSFLTVDYKKDVFALSSLLRGVLQVGMAYPGAKRFIGPVSISHDYPIFYRSLICHYLSRYKGGPEVSPSHRFSPDYLRVNPDQLFAGREWNPVEVDQLLRDISFGKYPLPTLVKTYFLNNAKTLCFNVDHSFDDCLDVMISAEFGNYPEKMLQLLMRGADEETIAKVIKTYGKERLSS